MERTKIVRKLLITIFLSQILVSTVFAFNYSRAEEIKYDVTYLGLPVVRVEVENSPIAEPDSGSYRIFASAKTTKFWSLFYPLENFYWTYLDTLGRPLIYKRIIKEKSYKNSSAQEFDHRFNRIYYEGDTAIDHPGNLQNFFSSVYRLREIPIDYGTADSFYINVEKASWKIKWSVEDREELQVLGREIDCYVVDVKFESMNPNAKRLRTDALSYNLMSEDTELKLYLSNDDWRLPIKMTYKLSPFDIQAKITEFPEGY